MTFAAPVPLWQSRTRAADNKRLADFIETLTDWMTVVSMDNPPRVFRMVLRTPQIFSEFQRQFTDAEVSLTRQISLAHGAVEIANLEGEELDKKAQELWSRTLGPKLGEASTETILDHGLRAERKLASGAWLIFAHLPTTNDQTGHWNKLVPSLLLEQEAPNLTMETRSSLLAQLWSSYCIYSDATNFLAALAFWGSRALGAVTVADMTLAGAPLVYVNDLFCTLSGYGRDEVLGHNCRFMQGPDTEAERVGSMQECLRRGVDCHVKLTNYKKNGTTFCNLLALRPMFDSNGVLRFVVGLQLEIRDDGDPANPNFPRKQI
eukprot:1337418-Prymnesium_polylepis.2